MPRCKHEETTATTYHRAAVDYTDGKEHNNPYIDDQLEGWWVQCSKCGARRQGRRVIPKNAPQWVLKGMGRG